MYCYFHITHRMESSQNKIINFTVFLLVYNSFRGFSWCLGGIVGKLTGGVPTLVVFVLTVLVYFYAYNKNKKSFDKRYVGCSIVIFLSYMFTYLVCYAKGTPVKLASILNIFYLPLFILIDDRLKYFIFQRYLKVIIIFFTLSFIEYLIYVIFHIGITLSIYIRNENSDSLANIQILQETIFNFIRTDIDFPRFQSLCQEPGQLGNVCWILIVLIGECKKYRKQQLLLFLFGVVSFSLAFYVIAFVYLISIKVRFKYIAAIIGVTGIFYFSFPQAFESLIFERVDGKTMEEIDNRTSKSFDFYFDKSIEDGSIILGNGGTRGEEIEGNNTGGKVILYEYGVVCTVLILLACLNGYISFSRKYGSVDLRKKLCLLLIFIGAFYKGGMIMSYYIMFLFIIYPLIYKINSLEQKS